MGYIGVGFGPLAVLNAFFEILLDSRARALQAILSLEGLATAYIKVLLGSNLGRPTKTSSAFVATSSGHQIQTQTPNIPTHGAGMPCCTLLDATAIH